MATWSIIQTSTLNGGPERQYPTKKRRPFASSALSIKQGVVVSGSVIAGAVAIDVVVSGWLLAFSMFIFTSLALTKRYVELGTIMDKGLPDPKNRNYKASDLLIVAALAAATGFNAVTVLALYVASPSLQLTYRHPELLWLICPIIMYWIGRILLMTHRRMIDDDPIVFALRDGVSRVAVGLMVIIVIAASL